MCFQRSGVRSEAEAMETSGAHINKQCTVTRHSDVSTSIASGIRLPLHERVAATEARIMLDAGRTLVELQHENVIQIAAPACTTTHRQHCTFNAAAVVTHFALA
jgi:hypothetical protein